MTDRAITADRLYADHGIKASESRDIAQAKGFGAEPWTEAQAAQIMAFAQEAKAAGNTVKQHLAASRTTTMPSGTTTPATTTTTAPSMGVDLAAFTQQQPQGGADLQFGMDWMAAVVGHVARIKTETEAMEWVNGLANGTVQPNPDSPFEVQICQVVQSLGVRRVAAIDPLSPLARLGRYLKPGEDGRTMIDFGLAGGQTLQLPAFLTQVKQIAAAE